MKKIYYITNMFPSKKDNYGIFCKKTYDFFQESDLFEVVKISAIKGKSQNKYYNIFRYARLLFSILITMMFYLSTIDVIYIQYIWKHAFFVANFKHLLTKKNKKIVLNYHGEDLTEYDSLSEKEKNKFIELCCIASAIVVPSTYFKNKLLEIVPNINSTKIIITPSGGVDSNNFFKKTDKVRSNSIVYCSRFDKDKGWDDFIMVANQLIKDLPSIRFIMIGYGKETDHVINLIEKNKLNNVIKVIVNPSQKRISEIYSESNLFVFPTRRIAESLGLVALEAMSCGLPVVSSDIGAVRDFVIPGETGFLYAPGNQAELREKILEFINVDILKSKEMRDDAINMAEKYRDTSVKTVFLQKINETV